MAKEPTMEEMLQTAVNEEDRQRAAKKKAISEGIQWGLRGLQQVGGALSAYNDASPYTGFEGAGEAKAIDVTNAASRLAQGDVLGAVISIFRGEELYAEQRR